MTITKRGFICLAAGLLAAEIFGGEPAEIVLAQRFDLLHIRIEALVIDTILETMDGTILSGNPAGNRKNRQRQYEYQPTCHNPISLIFVYLHRQNDRSSTILLFNRCNN